jgi:hypothetical protein
VGWAGVGAGAVAVLCAGCGVPATGVVDVGMPATGMPTPRDTRPEAIVYLLDGQRLQAVRRDVAGGPDPVATAVDLLFAGPAAAGRPDLATRLPRLLAQPGVRTQGHTVTVRLPAGLPEFGALGMRQLTCTVATAFRRIAPPPILPPATGTATPDAASADPAVPGGAAPNPAAESVRVEAVGSGWRLSQADPTCT